MPVEQLDLATIESSLPDIAKIGAEGRDRDGAFMQMAKGLTSGITSLIALIKAERAQPKPDEDEDEDEDENTDEEPKDGQPAPKPGEGQPGEPAPKPGEGAGGGAGPGYDDMQLGTDAVDVTEYVLSLETKVDAIRADNVALRKQLRSMSKAMSRTHSLLLALAETHATTTVPLVKGVMGIEERLLAIPAPSFTPGIDARRAAVRHSVGVARVTDDNPIEKWQLAKACQDRLIDEHDLQHYRRTGTFERPTATESADLIARLKAF